MPKIPATVAILTRNSAGTLARALESAKDFDEVLVCDGGSTDGTLDIARAFGARIIPQDSRYIDAAGRLTDFAGVRNACVAQAAYDWVLQIDSDEAVSPALAAEVRALLAAHPAPGAYRIPAGIMLDGVAITRSSNYPGHQVRFFNRRAGEYQKPIHERFVVNAGVPLGTLASPWHYFVDSHTAQQEFDADVVRDMSLYRAQYRHASWQWRLRGALASAKSMAGIVLRGGRNALMHRGPQTYPWRLERLRARYQWEIIKTLLAS